MIRALLRRAVRAVRRWNQMMHVRDVEHVIRHHERLLAGLPDEIRRLNQLRLYHLGCAETLRETRNPVNWNLGRSRS